MSKPIADYALLGNLRCAALVSRAGCIDWFCPGRFDSPACFAALLGEAEHGHWSIAPRAPVMHTQRHYHTDTLILETSFTTETGTVRIVDLMPVAGTNPETGCHIVRIVEGVAGVVNMHMRCMPRFDFGKDIPSTRMGSCGRILFESGDDQLALASDISQIQIEDAAAQGDFDISAGEQHWFTLSYGAAEQPLPPAPDAVTAMADCATWWQEWMSHCQYRGEWDQSVRRSLIILKAMIYAPTGGMVAAPTTSLPEVPGGNANYDYRFCWLRDAAFALKVLLNSGYKDEARAWRDWLLKVIDQHDEPLHALYTIDATVAPDERELPWLPGYLNSQPVRTGNAASRQYQIDLRGELMEVLHLARSHGLDLNDEVWQAQCEILENLESRWHKRDTGIWEFRTICDHLTHSKVLAWVAYDRCIRDAERFSLPAPLERWRQLRNEIRADVLARGVDPDGGHFTQRYGSPEVDASLLMIPLVGFLPADDPRMAATIAVIERDLCEDGFVRRYRTGDQANIEGVFLACCFWLADNYWLAGRKRDAEILFERLAGLCNDVGLLAEEYDPKSGQLLGNFPQGLSHLGLISTARLFTSGDKEDVSLN